MKDDVFIRDRVPMTKELIRAISIDQLNLLNARRLLDVGAGTGSISLQAAIEYPELEVTAIEHKELAVNLIKRNIEHFDLDNIEVIQAKAPHCPEVSGPYDAIFIGGSGGELEEIIDWSLDLLVPDGRLVLNFILLENALAAYDHLASLELEDVSMRQVQVSDWQALGPGHYFKPQNPTFIIQTQKGN